MKGGNLKLPVFYLKPGEVHIADQPGIVTTVLGSCVSVTMFHQKRELGAICHGLMPEWKGKGHQERTGDEGFKYVDYAITYMTDQFRLLGIDTREIEVKLFGGADMFPMRDDDRKHVTMGRQNVRAALRTLEREGLVIQTEDIGGTQGRKIHFHIHTGVVFLKRLRRSKSSEIIQRQMDEGKSGQRGKRASGSP